MRIGTIGTGFIVDDFFDAVDRVESAEIVAVYSRTEETAKAFAAKHNGVRWITDREAFLNDPELDVIYVASPNSLHYQWTKDALNAGKAVICEKPFVPTLAECEELVSLAQEKGLFLVEGITIPHLPNYVFLREHLHQIGKIRFVQLNFSQYSSKHKSFLEGKNPNVFNPAFAGGALMDINYYNMRFVLDLFGEPEDIHYFPNLAENGIDTSGVFVMQYPGFIAEGVGAKDSRSENMIQIQGERGFIKIPMESSLCISFTVTNQDGEGTYNLQEDDNPLFYELCDFVEAYHNQNSGNHKVWLGETRRAMKWLEIARKRGGVYFEGEA